MVANGKPPQKERAQMRDARAAQGKSKRQTATASSSRSHWSVIPASYSSYAAIPLTPASSSSSSPTPGDPTRRGARNTSSSSSLPSPPYPHPHYPFLSLSPTFNLVDVPFGEPTPSIDTLLSSSQQRVSTTTNSSASNTESSLIFPSTPQRNTTRRATRLTPVRDPALGTSSISGASSSQRQRVGSLTVAKKPIVIYPSIPVSLIPSKESGESSSVNPGTTSASSRTYTTSTPSMTTPISTVQNDRSGASSSSSPPEWSSTPKRRRTARAPLDFLGLTRVPSWSSTSSSLPSAQASMPTATPGVSGNTGPAPFSPVSVPEYRHRYSSPPRPSIQSQRRYAISSPLSPGRLHDVREYSSQSTFPPTPGRSERISIYPQTPTKKSTRLRPTNVNTSLNPPESSARSRKLAEEESIAFHDAAAARCNVCMFDALPIEILCTIMDYVVTPWTEDMAANDDGDGPRVGSSLRYWYSDFNRSLLRLVCRTWNLTILSMAREINIELGSDESMASLLESAAAERRSATTTQTRTSQHPPFSSASRSFWSSSNSGVRLHRTLRRSARLLEASTSVLASAASRPTSNPSYPYASTTQEPRISEDFNRYVGSHGIQSDQHPRLVQHIAQKLSESRRVVNQNFVSIGRFYNSSQSGRDSTKASAIASGSISNSKTANQALTPWTCPPNIRSLNVQGKLPRYLDPPEVVVLSANHSGTQHQTGGNGATTTSSSNPPRGLTNGKRHGTKLDNWLRAAVPKTITSFSISSSSDFGMDGLLLLPKSLTTLAISRCPRLTGGTLFIAFNHLSNLTRLTMCTELLFTDESFISALGNLTHLRQFDYMYPCDSVQPAWRDLFRYCSSCELYHRRMATKTYTRKLLMPVLPSQIRQFSFSMDEPRFRHQRIENSDQNNQYNSDRDNTKFWLCLWKADEADPQNTNSSVSVDSGDQGSDHKSDVDSVQRSMPRSWWPENLTRLDLSRCAVFDSRFDVPSQLKELVIAYPLEPNEIQVEGSDSNLEEDKQWFPESLVSLEVHGAPYHVSCEIYDNPSGNVTSWMNYTNTMLKRVPRHLEHFIITSFQVPDTDALNALQARVGKTLKTWIVKLLCPQQPKKSGHSSLQLYTPVVYMENDYDAFDDDDEEVVNDSWWSWMGMGSDDSDLDFYQESPSSRASGRVFRRQQSVWGSLNGSRNSHISGHEETRHLTESEQYSVTPVMLRNATKGMVVLEKLEVHVNFQHYRLCQSIWKDRLGLSEPVSVDVFGNDARDPTNLTQAGISNRNSRGKSSSSSLFPPSRTPILKKNVHLRDGDEDVLDLVTKYRLKKKKLSSEDLPTQYQYTRSLLQGIEGKGKGVHREAHLGLRFPSPVDIKGKGKKVESSLSLDGVWSPLKEEEDEDEGMAANPSFDSILECFESFSKSKGDSSSNSGSNNINSKILGHGKVKGCPTTKIVYWNNSCCGKRCLGWSRNHH